MKKNKKNTYSKKEFLKKIKMTSLEFQEWEKALKNNYTIARTETNARIFTDNDVKLFLTLHQQQVTTSKTKEEIVQALYETTAIIPKEETVTVIDKETTPIEQLSTLITNQIELNMDKLKEEIILSLQQQADKTNHRLHSIDSHLKHVAQTNVEQTKELQQMEKMLEENHFIQQENMNVLVQTIEENRITQLEISKNERDRFYRDVSEREVVFQELISNFRHVAATKEPAPKNNWWKFWKF